MCIGGGVGRVDRYLTFFDSQLVEGPLGGLGGHYLGGGVPSTPHIIIIRIITFIYGQILYSVLVQIKNHLLVIFITNAKRVVYSKPPSLLRVVYC